MYVTMVKCVPARADCPINKLQAERHQPRTYRDVVLFIRHTKKQKKRERIEENGAEEPKTVARVRVRERERGEGREVGADCASLCT